MMRLPDSESLRRALIAPFAVGSLLMLASCGDGEDTAEDDAGDTQTEEQGEQEKTGQGAEEGDDGEGDAAQAFTLEEVEDNDGADSCWAVVDGTVYDLTDWIDEHPGGPDRIEQLCGTDATDAFEGQHGGDEGPQQQLSEFEIGELES